MTTLTDVSKDELSRMQAELEEELLQAEIDFASGNFIELTVEQLEECAATGKWPWPDDGSLEPIR